MNIFAELLKWEHEKKLPYWEQYALDLIVAGKSVGESEISEMVTFLLEDARLIKKEAPRHKLTALEKAAVAISSPAVCKTLLRAVSKTENINALVPNQRLEFGNQLTIIYGANGSGKSGYSRLLAGAGFSRGDRDVLPNIAQPEVESVAQGAVFHLERDGELLDIPFVVGEECPDLIHAGTIGWHQGHSSACV